MRGKKGKGKIIRAFFCCRCLIRLTSSQMKVGKNRQVICYVLSLSLLLDTAAVAAAKFQVVIFLVAKLLEMHQRNSIAMQ